MGDLFRGAHKTARTADKVKKCQELVERDKTVGVHALAHRLQVSYGTTLTILHKDLLLKKRAAKMIPHLLTPRDMRLRMEFAQEMLDQFATDRRCLEWIVTTDESWFHVYEPKSSVMNRHWLAKGAERPQIVRRERSVKQVLFIPFFDHRGLIHWEFIDNGTVTKEIFLPMLKRVHESIRLRRGTRVWFNRQQLMLHMDNAPAHRSDLVQEGLRQLQWPTLKHPPYSPDLSPPDFFLFPYLKRQLRGINFGTTAALKDAIETLIGLIPSDLWRSCFEDWFHRCTRCILFKGGYFEGMSHPPTD